MDAYDVIIIGTGAGGGTLAHKLAPSGKKILLLERGGYLPREPENWDSREVFRNERYLDDELCAGDPFCAHRAPSPNRGDLNGAACHSCLLISETACEAGNRYLDRATVVRTLADVGTEFFGR